MLRSEATKHLASLRRDPSLRSRPVRRYAAGARQAGVTSHLLESVIEPSSNGATHLSGESHWTQS